MVNIPITTLAITGILFSQTALAEIKKPEWLFVHTATSADMISNSELVVPVNRDIFAFSDRPNRLHAYMNASEFASWWDEGEGDTFIADPPNAVLTWVDGGNVQEAEFIIINAEALRDDREISYEVKLEAGELPEGNIAQVSFFVDMGCCAHGFKGWWRNMHNL